MEHPYHRPRHPRPGDLRRRHLRGLPAFRLEALRAPHFPFGFGLSYTTFRYSNLFLQLVGNEAAEPQVLVGFDVTNTGVFELRIGASSRDARILTGVVLD